MQGKGGRNAFEAPRRILPLAALALVLVAGCGGDGDSGGGGGGELVFGTASDPVVLDGALVSDGESLRAIDQMFEGLVTLKQGGTEVVPGLAESWEADAAGTSWTFTLRDGVEFHDGEPFNAEAVCFNFDRWYNFKGPFQLESATYYWQTVFGGFSDRKTPSLYKSCEATDETTVVINLTKPSASFLGALALTNFTFASPKALQEFGADEGSVDEETGFKPTGTYGTEHPTGTGPFKFESWTRGDRLVMVRNDDYWGEKAKLERLIFRPISDNAARLQALQNGDIQGYDLVEPQDIQTIEGDDTLQILDRPAFNVAYVGINQKMPPMDKLEVRQAIAHGLDRAGRRRQLLRRPRRGGDAVHAAVALGLCGRRHRVPVRPGEGEVAAPAGRRPDAARDRLLVPDRRLAAVHARPEAELRGLRGQPEQVRLQGRAAQRAVEPRLPGRGAGRQGRAPAPARLDGRLRRPGQLHRHLLPAADRPVRLHERRAHAKLDEAETETDEAKRTTLYQEANRMIMDFLPGVPYVHTEPAIAFNANVKGYVPSPVSLEPFSIVSIERSELT